MGACPPFFLFSKMNQKLPTLFFSYAWNHKWMSAIALYSMIAIFICILFNVDIGIPCLWRTCFDFECPGCGLTTAFMKLLQCNPTGAYQSNPLIFLVAPAGILYVWIDFRRFISTR